MLRFIAHLICHKFSEGGCGNGVKMLRNICIVEMKLESMAVVLDVDYDSTLGATTIGRIVRD